ncbi:hypothetical protein DFJ74DRAFT_669064 [Hyaloraphidium curvatum]|nr:hypothetical protein DFJ74DRAFT_669064 [Hyaloraphidium curvatum]
MVAGTTAICISQFFLLVTFLVGMFRTELSSNAGHGETRPEGKREAGPAPVSLDHHSCAGFSRWSALAVFAGTNGGLEKLGDDARAQTPWLVRHQPGDRLCPCAARSCGGEVVRSAAAMWLLHATVFWMFGTAVLIMRTYTQLVYFGSLLWNSWWAFFAVWFLIGNSFVQIFLHFFARPAAIAPLQLAHRLQHRACSAAIRSLMYKLERCAEGSDPPPTSQELYVQLHRRLTIQWRSLFVLSANSDKSIFSIMAVELSGAVIYMIFGACLPAWCIIIQLFYFSHILGDLISVAAANSQIDDIVELYTAARQDILGLLVDVRDPPTAALMQHHADLLDSFRDVGLLRARFLGVSVTVGTVRSLIVALVPILAALWTVLRGLGVSFTPQTICPG